MSEFTRKASLFGGPKVVLGTESTDLVLETLGKIYIKTGKKARLLNDVFKLLDGLNDPAENVGSKTLIVETLKQLKTEIKYPGDGYLIFVSEEKALYISYDDRYLLLLDEVVDPDQPQVSDTSGYVRRRGDRMTGQLEIAVTGKAPLIVASTDLVKNFNAQFINSYASHELAIKKLNEYIEGTWTFANDTTFESNVKVNNDIKVLNNATIGNDVEIGNTLTIKNKTFAKNDIHAEKDIILTGSIGSPEFMSGYNGYGWRFDADTNMLTVDYLVVRKAMQVFELIVNRIQATNGSLWVTDSCEVKEITEITYQAIETTTQNKTNFQEAATKQNEVNLKKDYLSIAKNIFAHSGNLLANTNYATDAQRFIENEYFALLEDHKDKFPILEVQNLCTTYNNLYSNCVDNVHEVPSTTQIRLPLGGASIKIMSNNVTSLKINGINIDELTELIFIDNLSNNYNDVSTVVVEAELKEGTSEWMYSIGYHYSEILQQILDCQVTNYFYQLFPAPDTITNPIGIEDLKDRSTFENKIQTLESNIVDLETTIANYNIESTIDLPRGVWIALNRQEQSIHGKYLKSVSGVFEDEDVIFYVHSHIIRINDYNKVLTMVNNRLSNLNTDDVLTPTSFLQQVLCSTDDVEFRQQLLEARNSDNNPIIQCVETINPEFYNAVMFSTDNKTEIDTLDEITILKTYYKYFGLTKERQDLQESNILANMYIVRMKDDSYATFDTGDIIRCQKFEDHSVKYYDALVGSRIDAYTYVIIKSPSVFDTQVTISTDENGNQDVSTELNLNQYNKTFNGYYRESNITYYKLNGIDINYAPIVFSYMYNMRQLDKSEKPLFIDDKYIEDINDIKFSQFTKIEVANTDDYSTVFKDQSGNLFALSTEDFTMVPAFTGTYIKHRYVNINGAFCMVEDDKIMYFGNEYEVVDNKVIVGENTFDVQQDTYEINPLVEGVDSRIVTLIKYNNELLSNEDFICYILSDVRVSLAEDGQVVEYYQAPAADGLESERVQTSRIIAEIAPKDGLVRVGNLMNSQRQNSVFITSSEWDSPYVQTMSGVCRPDYTVAYKQPKFSKWKVRTAVNSIRFKFIQRSEEAIVDKIYLLPTDEEFIQSVLNKSTYTTFTEIQKCVVKQYFDGFKFNDQYYTFMDNIPNNDETAHLTFEIETTQVTDKLTGEVSTKYLATYCDHIKARFGKLDGIEHENFSRNDLTQPHGYGLYGENVYLTGEFVLSNGKSIATIGDDILFKVAESGMHIEDGKITLDADKIFVNNGDKTAALFKDGKIYADYIDTKDLVSDRIIGRKYDYLVFEGTIGTKAYKSTYLFDFENKTYTICGVPNSYTLGYPETAFISNLNNFTLNSEIIYRYDETVDTITSTIYLTQVFIAQLDDKFYKFTLYYMRNEYLVSREEFTNLNAVEPLKATDEFKFLCIKDNLPYKKVSTESIKVITINENNQGETILYYPDGSVKYARVETADSKSIEQFVEYWYDKGVCDVQDIQLGTIYLDRKGGYVKRLDALENPFVIDQVSTFYTLPPSDANKVAWIAFWASILNDHNLNWYYKAATDPLQVMFDQYTYDQVEDSTYKAPTYNDLQIRKCYVGNTAVSKLSKRIFISQNSKGEYLSYEVQRRYNDDYTYIDFILHEDGEAIVLKTEVAAADGKIADCWVVRMNGNLYYVTEAALVDNKWYPVVQAFVNSNFNYEVGYTINIDEANNSITATKCIGDRNYADGVFTANSNMTSATIYADHYEYNGVKYALSQYVFINGKYEKLINEVITVDSDNKYEAFKTKLQELSDVELDFIITDIYSKLQILGEDLPEAIKLLKTYQNKFKSDTTYTRDKYSDFINTIQIPNHLKQWFYANPMYFKELDQLHLFRNNQLFPQYDQLIRETNAYKNLKSYQDLPKKYPYISNATTLNGKYNTIPSKDVDDSKLISLDQEFGNVAVNSYYDIDVYLKTTNPKTLNINGFDFTSTFDIVQYNTDTDRYIKQKNKDTYFFVEERYYINGVESFVCKTTEEYVNNESQIYDFYYAGDKKYKTNRISGEWYELTKNASGESVETKVDVVYTRAYNKLAANEPTNLILDEDKFKFLYDQNIGTAQCIDTDLSGYLTVDYEYDILKYKKDKEATADTYINYPGGYPVSLEIRQDPTSEEYYWAWVVNNNIGDYYWWRFNGTTFNKVALYNNYNTEKIEFADYIDFDYSKESILKYYVSTRYTGYLVDNIDDYDIIKLVPGVVYRGFINMYGKRYGVYVDSYDTYLYKVAWENLKTGAVNIATVSAQQDSVWLTIMDSHNVSDKIERCTETRYGARVQPNLGASLLNYKGEYVSGQLFLVQEYDGSRQPYFVTCEFNDDQRLELTSTTVEGFYINIPFYFEYNEDYFGEIQTTSKKYIDKKFRQITFNNALHYIEDINGEYCKVLHDDVPSMELFKGNYVNSELGVQFLNKLYYNLGTCATKTSEDVYPVKVACGDNLAYVAYGNEFYLGSKMELTYSNNSWQFSNYESTAQYNFLINGKIYSGESEITIDNNTISIQSLTENSTFKFYEYIIKNNSILAVSKYQGDSQYYKVTDQYIEIENNFYSVTINNFNVDEYNNYRIFLGKADTDLFITQEDWNNINNYLASSFYGEETGEVYEANAIMYKFKPEDFPKGTLDTVLISKILNDNPTQINYYWGGNLSYISNEIECKSTVDYSNVHLYTFRDLTAHTVDYTIADAPIITHFNYTLYVLPDTKVHEIELCTGDISSPGDLFYPMEITMKVDSIRALRTALIIPAITKKHQIGIKQLYTYFITILGKTIQDLITGEQTFSTFISLQKSRDPIVYTTYSNYSGINLLKLKFKNQWAHIANLIVGKNQMASYNSEIVDMYLVEYPLITSNTTINVEKSNQFTGYETKRSGVITLDKHNNIYVQDIALGNYQDKVFNNHLYNKWINWEKGIGYVTDTVVYNNNIMVSLKNTSDNKFIDFNLSNFDINTKIPQDGLIATKLTSFQLDYQNINQGAKTILISNDDVFSSVDIPYYATNNDLFIVPEDPQLIDIYTMLIEANLSKNYLGTSNVRIKSIKNPAGYDYYEDGEKHTIEGGVGFIARNGRSSDDDLMTDLAYLYQIYDRGCVVYLADEAECSKKTESSYGVSPQYTNFVEIEFPGLYKNLVSKMYVFILRASTEMIHSTVKLDTYYPSAKNITLNGNYTPLNYKYCLVTSEEAYNDINTTPFNFNSTKFRSINFTRPKLNCGDRLTDVSEIMYADATPAHDIGYGLFIHNRIIPTTVYYWYYGARKNWSIGSVDHSGNTVISGYNGWNSIAIPTELGTATLLNSSEETIVQLPTPEWGNAAIGIPKETYLKLPVDLFNGIELEDINNPTIKTLCKINLYHNEVEIKPSEFVGNSYISSATIIQQDNIFPYYVFTIAGNKLNNISIKITKSEIA